MAKIDLEVYRQGVIRIVIWNLETIDRFMSARSKIGAR